MAMNRVQFQRGMSWRDVQSRYGSEAACEAVLTQMRWPEGFVCPRCGEGAASTFRHRGKPLWQCSACRLQASLVAGTMFAHSRLPLTVWFQAIWLLTQSKNNVAALELSRLLGVCYASAWRLKRKLSRQADKVFLEPSAAWALRSAGVIPPSASWGRSSL
jgi:ribosomal protein L37AE/L43A